METDTGTKKCPFCAEDIKLEAIACRYCGRDLESQTSTLASESFGSSLPVNRDSNSIALSIASLILGIISSAIGLVDLGLVQNGTYDYILDSEIGLLAIMSLISLGLGIAAKVKRQRVSMGALIISILSVIIFLACTSYSQYVV